MPDPYLPGGSGPGRSPVRKRAAVAQTIMTPCLEKVKGQPGGTALLTTTVAGELCPDGGEGRKLLRGLEEFCEVGRERKIRGHGKAGEEAYHSRPGVAYGSGGACGVRQNLLVGWWMRATGGIS